MGGSSERAAVHKDGLCGTRFHVRASPRAGAGLAPASRCPPALPPRWGLALRSRRGGGFSSRLGGGRARPCCPACSRPSCGAAPPELAASPPGGHSPPPPSKPPWLSPRQRAALCSPLLPARAQLHFQLLQTLAALAIRRLPPAGPAPPVPASLRAIPLKGCSCRLLSQSLVDSVWDEGWRLPARERRPLGSFPFAK